MEKQTGVDVNALCERYPETTFIGNFDKMIMHKGEAALRNEFERLWPVLLDKRYIASVDHQTPPSVSLEDYRIYAHLLHEYARRKR